MLVRTMATASVHQDLWFRGEGQGWRKDLYQARGIQGRVLTMVLGGEDGDGKGSPGGRNGICKCREA